MPQFTVLSSQAAPGFLPAAQAAHDLRNLLATLGRSDVPLLLIWGKSDPYLHVTVAEYMRSQARNAAIHILEAGHWPQIDEPADVARIMLASQ
jgi:pimeloyl-ACP methyl ester carboxylesterase